jgi:(p)ppGpp synthase/HD superfamily hydrolase
MSTLERAIEIAARAHAGKKDKAGAPYILHPLRVMLKLSYEEEQITAVLHDVIEDSDLGLDDIRREGFSRTIVAAIDSVTIRKGETYNQYIMRAAANPIGRRVKLADLEDNCDLSRLASPTRPDQDRMVKYRRAIELIMKC